MSAEPRIVVLPREVASGVITTALARGAWGVSLAIVVLTFPVLFDVALARGLEEALFVPLLSLVGLLLLLVLAGWWPSDLTRVLFLAGGSALAFVYGTSLLTADPSLNGEAAFLVNRPLLVLVLVGAGVRKPVVGLAWAGLGYALAVGVGVAIAVNQQVAFLPGWGPTLAILIYATTYLAVAIMHSMQSNFVPDLAKLEADTRRMDLESQFEQRAAAIVHDTVLSDLSAVMNSPGALDERAREKLRADVATLADPSWLRESAPSAGIATHDAHLRNAFVSLVSEYQWRGLTVDLADDTEQAVVLSPESESLVIAAVAACLDNVLQHSGASTAEIVLSSTPGEVSAMVVDSGVGFNAADVAPDRLGIRNSIVHRIESIGGSVRIWSTPGHGTSIFLRVPFANGSVPVDAGADE